MKKLKIVSYSQKGRSMIEMLGVLAIIGVLSIGGIAGYSKAMTKYRVNKMADQISQLAQNIRTLYASQRTYNTLSDNVIKKAHLAPEDMYDGTTSTSLYNPFGGWLEVIPSGKNSSGDNKAFYIRTGVIPQEACVELATMDWGSGSSSGLIVVYVDSSSASSVGTPLYGCSSGGSYTCAKDGVMSVDKAVSLCAHPTSNGLGLKFY